MCCELFRVWGWGFVTPGEYHDYGILQEFKLEAHWFDLVCYLRITLQSQRFIRSLLLLWECLVSWIVQGLWVSSSQYHGCGILQVSPPFRETHMVKNCWRWCWELLLLLFSDLRLGGLGFLPLTLSLWFYCPAMLLKEQDNHNCRVMLITCCRWQDAFKTTDLLAGASQDLVALN